MAENKFITLQTWGEGTIKLARKQWSGSKTTYLGISRKYFRSGAYGESQLLPDRIDSLLELRLALDCALESLRQEANADNHQDNGRPLHDMTENTAQGQ